MIENFTPDSLQDSSEMIKSRESTKTDEQELQVAGKIDALSSLIQQSAVDVTDKTELSTEIQDLITALANAESDSSFVELAAQFDTAIDAFFVSEGIDPATAMEKATVTSIEKGDVTNDPAEALDKTGPVEAKDKSQTETKAGMRERLMKMFGADKFGRRFQKLKAGVLDYFVESAEMLKQLVTNFKETITMMAKGLVKAVKEWRSTLKAIGKSIRDAFSNMYDFGKMSAEVIFGFVGGGAFAAFKRTAGVAKIGNAKKSVANDNLASANDNFSTSTKADRMEIPDQMQKTGTDDMAVGRFNEGEMMRNAELSPVARQATAAKALGRDLTPQQNKALLRAHEVGAGGKGQYTMRELAAKRQVLMKEGGFSKADATTLMDKGIAGIPSRMSLRNLPDAPRIGSNVRNFDDLVKSLDESPLGITVKGTNPSQRMGRKDSVTGDTIRDYMNGDPNAMRRINELNLNDRATINRLVGAEKVRVQKKVGTPDVKLDKDLWPDGMTVKSSDTSWAMGNRVRKGPANQLDLFDQAIDNIAKSPDAEKLLSNMVKRNADGSVSVKFQNGRSVDFTAQDIQRQIAAGQKSGKSPGQNIIRTAIDKVQTSGPRTRPSELFGEFWPNVKAA